MTAYFRRFLRNFRPASPVPFGYREAFKHLYLDILWFGVLSGTTVAFLAVFATRQGASPEQIGLLSAAPALVNLLFALPVGSWLSKRSIGRSVFWTSVLQRMFYLLLVPLPAVLMPGAQVWVIIVMTLVMTIPGTAVVVGFNSLFGEVVPVEWRGHVVGIRNALLSLTTTIFTLLSGAILDNITFQLGYQIVFALGFVGAGLSSVHLFHLSKFVDEKRSISFNRAQPASATSRRLANEMRAIYQRGIQSLRLDVMHGHFAKMMGLLFSWYFVHFMSIPIITPFIVNVLHMSDQTIGLSVSLFNATMFLGSLALNRVTSRFGNKRITGLGVMGLSLFPLLTILGVGGYITANLMVGFAWAMAGGALYNYILENVPPNDRPAYLAWYSMASNGAILMGSLLGPVIAGQIGFTVALLIFGIGRFLAGAAILRWG